MRGKLTGHYLIFVLSALGLVASAQAPVTMAGVINDARCGATVSNDCARKGEPVVFVSDDDRSVYTIMNQDMGERELGKHVTATGTLAGSSLTLSKLDGIRTPPPANGVLDVSDPSLPAPVVARMNAAGENPQIAPGGPGTVFEAAELAAGGTGPAPTTASNGAPVGSWAGNLLADDGASVVSVRVMLNGASGEVHDVTDGCDARLSYLRTDGEILLYKLDYTNGACRSGNVRFKLNGSGLQWGLGNAGTLPPAAAPAKKG